jgi:CDP-glucose 4,6-dehydratase
VEGLEGVKSNFWNGKRVLLTGHTGFKGTWMAYSLARLGAKVTGLAHAPETDPSLFQLLSPDVVNITADIRDSERVRKTVCETAPEIIIHMAAQALVRRSYREPVETFFTNVMGTVHLLEAIRSLQGPVTTLVVTSDKVYRNIENGSAFNENDPLGGDDPYSASKAAAEMAVHSWRASFATAGHIIASARAGNVIGGGDFSEDRLVPDIYRAMVGDKPLVLRYPQAVRPWQHVLDTVFGYLAYVEVLSVKKEGVPLAINFGPDRSEAVTAENLLKSFEQALGKKVSRTIEANVLPEKSILLLDTSLAEKCLNWRNRLSMAETVKWTADWYAGFHDGKSARELCERQFDDYCARAK